MLYNKDMSYDIKYRERVLKYLSEGHSEREAATVFRVSRTTIWKWKSRLNETGTLAPAKRKETWRKIEPKKLREYVAEHPDAYQYEIAAAFGVRLYAIQKELKRLGITRKKTTIYRERNESYRQAFVEKLKTISPEQLIYVDEACVQGLYSGNIISTAAIAALQLSAGAFKLQRAIAGRALIIGYLRCHSHSPFVSHAMLRPPPIGCSRPIACLFILFFLFQKTAPE